MDHLERGKLDQAIQAELVNLGREVAQLKEEVKPIAPDRAIGRLTRMEAINAKSICEANLRTAKLRMVKLQDALKNLDDEDFGICQRCERPIPYKRLLLLPESIYCVACLSR